MISVCIFFFKQKTAYEMRISDWSSDVCSSDLNLYKQLSLGIITRAVICLGTGKNYHFLNKINKEFGFFDTIIPLEHPRYIIQYKSKEKAAYIKKYVTLMQSI